MYVDQKTLEKQKNEERLKDAVILILLLIFIAFEFQSVRDILVRMTHKMIVTQTSEIHYERSGLGLWLSPTVTYSWKGVDYQTPVGGLLVANSAAIIPPVKLLVDPENPQLSVLKTPYGGWSSWWIDFAILQTLFAGFIYVAFVGPYKIRKRSYFQ